MKGQPIKPSEVTRAKQRKIPAEVIEVFNELIASNWNGLSSIFGQREVVAAILAKMPNTERATVYARHWLDVEPLYEAEGWIVEYDKPGFNETYEPTFTFCVKKKRR